MDESRKQFEEWIKFQSDEDEMNGKLERANSGSNYADSTTDICWIAWQASRAAIGIELPEACSCCYSESEKEWHDSVMGEVTDILIAAGIKAKE